MALSINLYHEVLRARKQEQYDPLKLSLLGMIVIATCMVGYYLFEVSKKNAAVSAAAVAQAEYDQIRPEATQAKAKEEKLIKEINLAESLIKRIEGRFYWAPVLEQIALVVPRTVQLYKLNGEVLGENPRRCQFTIEGTAAGAEPRKIAEELRTAIVERFAEHFQNPTAAFKSLDDSNERVLLDGNQYASVAFSIGVSFETKSSDPKATPAGNPSPRIAQKN